MAAVISGRYPSLNDTMLGWNRNDFPHWFAMIRRAIGRGEVNPYVEPAIVFQVIVTFVCRATTVLHASAAGAE
jgi:hypothetical protein